MQRRVLDRRYGRSTVFTVLRRHSLVPHRYDAFGPANVGGGASQASSYTEMCPRLVESNGVRVQSP